MVTSGVLLSAGRRPAGAFGNSWTRSAIDFASYGLGPVGGAIVATGILTTVVVARQRSIQKEVKKNQRRLVPVLVSLSIVVPLRGVNREEASTGFSRR